MGAGLSLFEAHLPVRDLDASIAFYRDRVGLDLAHRVADRAAFMWVGGRGRAMLGLWSAGDGPQTIGLHIAFASTIAEVRSAPSTLRAAGITPLDFDGRPTDDAVVLGWMPAVAVYFRDPDGHLLEYIAMLPDAPRPAAGVITWDAWSAASQAGPAAGVTGPAVVRILAISGSLRRASANSALVDAAVRLAPPGVELHAYGELASIPPFNPDLDTDAPPEAVRRFRQTLEASDGFLISSPEYAHGIPGVLKNALDWVVGSGELIDKPVALVNASARATHARDALAEVLTTMSARVVAEASPTIAIDGSRLDASGLTADPRVSALLGSAIVALRAACVIRHGKSTEPTVT